MNIHVQNFVKTYVFMYLGYISRSRIATSQGNSMFNCLKKCQTVFQSSCTLLPSHHQCTRVPICPCLCQHLLVSIFFITAILMGVKQYFIIVQTCVSLTVNDVEYLFICFWPPVYLLWRHVYLSALPTFYLGYLTFFIFEFHEFFTYTGYKSLIRNVIAKVKSCLS